MAIPMKKPVKKTVDIRSNEASRISQSPNHRARPNYHGRVDADMAKITAVEYCLFHYATMYTGGVPRAALLPQKNAWLVPIVLEDPDAGISIEVGELHIDARTGKVIFATPRKDVVATGGLGRPLECAVKARYSDFD
jgi:hypothetical protein